MSIRTTWVAGAHTLGVSAAVFALLACGDNNETGADDASTADGATEASHDAGLDGATPASEGGSPDAAGTGADAQTPADAAGAEAAANDAASAAIGIRGLYAHICTASSYGSPLSAVGANPQATQLGDMAFGFVEGPVWVEAENALFFSDMNFATTANLGPLSQIWRMDVSGHATSFVASSGSNGLALGARGQVARGDPRYAEPQPVRSHKRRAHQPECLARREALQFAQRPRGAQRWHRVLHGPRLAAG